jgi:hypothetical protein
MSDEIRIEFLEVHFDVVGNDEAEFVRLFEKYVNRWSRMQAEERQRRARAEQDRVVGDRPAGGDGS